MFHRPAAFLAAAVLCVLPTVVRAATAANNDANQVYQYFVPGPAQKNLGAYLWVPPGHQKKWSKHCREYNACGVPVYFVDDGWYQQNVNRRGGPPGRDRYYDDHPGKGKDKDRGNGKGHGNGKGRD